MKKKQVCYLVLFVWLIALAGCGFIWPKVKTPNTFNVVSGRVTSEKVIADEVNKMVAQMDIDDVIEYLRANSVNVIESPNVSGQRVADILMNNIKMKKRAAVKAVNKADGASYRYNLQPYQSGNRWVYQWIVYQVRRG